MGGKGSLTDLKGQNLCKILRSFVEKVTIVAILRLLVAFFCHILELYVTFLAFFCTFWFFSAVYAVLSEIRFVVIYALFWVKYFLAQTMLV